MNNPFQTQEELNQFNNDLMKEIKTLFTTKNYIKYVTIPGKRVEIYGYLEKGTHAMYGLKPCYGTEYIKEIMFNTDKKNNPFSSKESFIEFIRNNDSLLGSFGSISEKDRMGLWGRILLNCSRFFMTAINFQSINCLYRFKNTIFKILSPYVELKIDSQKKSINIWGRIPDDCLQELDHKLGLRYLDEKIYAGSLQLYKDKWRDLYKNINEKYTNPDMPALYSGVIPYLRSIQHTKLHNVNPDVEYLQFDVIKTTYFTMDGIENNLLNNHPFMDIYKSDLEKLDKKELNLAEEAADRLKKCQHIDETLQIINRYLQNSCLIHNVNVCGNVITSDNYCIYTKRQDKMYDSNKYYCSVNGTCEFQDSGVDFYKIPNIDCPTIEENCEQFSIMKELSREAMAELNIFEHVGNIQCIGFSIMGNFPDDFSASKKFLPFFFNVIGEFKTSYSLEDIENMQRGALEKFENKLVRGFRAIIVDGLLAKIVFRFLINVIVNLYDQKWVNGVLGILILLGIIEKSKNIMLGTSEWIWTIFFCGVVLFTTINALMYIRKYLNLKRNLFILKTSNGYIAYKAKRIVRRKQNPENRDTIMVLLSMLYIYTMAKKITTR